MIWLGNITAGVIIVALVVAACSDIALRIIPNSVAVVVAFLGLIFRLLTSPVAAGLSAAAAVILFAMLLVLYTRGMLGGGDVKLVPAIALGLPLSSISHFIFVMAMSGGVLAVFHLVGRWSLRGRPAPPPPRGASLPRRIFCAERWRIARHGSLPYGVAIACGGIWVIMSRVGG